MFLRPLSAAVKVISGLSVWIHVHVERQPLASGAAELSLALSTSIFTVPTKAGAIVSFAAFKAAMSRLTDVPAILVLILPVVTDVAAFTALEVSYPPRRAGVWAFP